MLGIAVVGWSRVAEVSMQATLGREAVLGSAKGARLGRVAEAVPVLRAAQVGEGGGYHHWREDFS